MDKSRTQSKHDQEEQEGRASFVRRILCAGLPLLLSNPDGSLSESHPCGYRDPTPPRTPRDGFLTAADISARLFGDVLGSGDPTMVAEEITVLYERHRTAFAILLFVQAVLQGLFSAFHITHSSIAIHDLTAMYRSSSHHLMSIIFWTLVGAEIVYTVVYLGIGCWSMYTHKAKHYAYFSTWCLAGIVGHVLLAYANQFNIIIFFLRLISYIYGKFLRDIVVGMMLLPAHHSSSYIDHIGNHTPESFTPASLASLQV